METRLVKINNMEDCKKDMEEAGELIKAGELVAFPTETVYGLGGNGLLPDAAKKIYAAKGRPSDNPLILHVCDMQMGRISGQRDSRQCKTCDGTFLAGTYDGDLAESGSGTRLCDRRT